MLYTPAAELATMRRWSALTEADLISREELYELVWTTPMTKAAEKFKVSGSYLARVPTFALLPSVPSTIACMDTAPPSRSFCEKAGGMTMPS